MISRAACANRLKFAQGEEMGRIHKEKKLVLVNWPGIGLENFN